MKTLNANEIYDKGIFNRYHFNLLFWLFVIIIFDGYDTAIYGAVVPILMEEWSLTPVEAGAIGSYTVMGTVAGAFIFGLMADKIGPKKVTMISVLIFSVFTVLAGFANDPGMFTACRVIAGLGLGGVMPNVVALTTEFAPKKMRNAMIAIVFCGYSVGSMTVALVGKSIIGTMGWQPLYWLAGIMLLIMPFLLKSIPESLQVLARQDKQEKIRTILKKAIPNHSLDDSIIFEKIAVQKQQKSSIGSLFSNKRGFTTLMLWITSFCCFILIYAMNTWLTKLMMQAGYQLDSSLLFLAVLNVGAIIAVIAGGALMEKYGFKKVLVPLYLLGSIALVFISVTENIVLAYVLVAIIGAASIGMHCLMFPLAAQYYPPEMRSTGVGVMMAFGRIGGIVSPTLIGMLMALNLTVQMNFMVIAIAGVIGSIAVLLVQEKYAYYAVSEKQPVQSGKAANS
ncbi:MFS transporter [Bacillus benzoevorans]|uniref:AAHS family benzoate transporter-like MFS transporter n=1 Tax=Bacillus benzoevorans TaxID=1456 RepID=A0A7X0HT09_9BACI|nr:aromatic acid/H+ symport family MFS transporter [Bacillus benzoevorans]MBB6446266.1 AAHS family benzoate transporter-like MFS transporter [Bacillus benzoevorans]